ncbi:hypothetical protein ABZ568_36210, partial [Streptomyces olindensis]
MRHALDTPQRPGEVASEARPARSPVHASSGHRLGVARPRQEGPTDLRLVPPALAAWGTAALTLDLPAGWVVGIVAVCLVAAGLLASLRPGHRHLRHPAAAR